MSKNKYINFYKNELLEEGNSLFYALKFAIRSYIMTRENWLSRCRIGLFGWRGGFKSGKLFFNRRLTEQNIAAMREVIEVIDNQEYTGSMKVHAISLISKKLSPTGRGYELLSTFLKVTGLEGKSSYLGAIEGWEHCIVINGHSLEPGRNLGSGNHGEVYKLKRSDGAEAFGNGAVKTFSDNDSLTVDNVVEIQNFEYVYNMLGPRFILHARQFASDFHLSTNPQRRFKFSVMPYVKGIPIKEYVKQRIQRKKYDEFEVLINNANFLYEVHNIGVVHRDLVPNNIIVVNNLGGVFFVDFGSALRVDMKERSELTDKWYGGITRDLAAIIIFFFWVRWKRGKDGDPWQIEDLDNICHAMRIERWIQDPAFFNVEYGVNFIDDLIEKCYYYRELAKMPQHRLFSPKSIEKARKLATPYMYLSDW
ncbi:serine/threonine-protein kinase [Lentisphaerota bacterium WC36G]|nr:serine/threonine-protein kinase [Lentisphaerae bacterium WC36]